MESTEKYSTKSYINSHLTKVKHTAQHHLGWLDLHLGPHARAESHKLMPSADMPRVLCANLWYDLTCVYQIVSVWLATENKFRQQIWMVLIQHNFSADEINLQKRIHAHLYPMITQIALQAQC
ncbi:hypothetical protein ACJX0J_021900, partial [Zea mays]